MSEVNIDDLSLRISASAESADSALDRLAAGLDSLLASLDPAGRALNDFNSALSTMQRQVDAFAQHLRDTKFNLKLNIDGAHQIDDIKQAIDAVSKTVDGSKLANSIADQFHIDSAGIRSQLTAQINAILLDAVQSFDGKTVKFEEATAAAMNEIRKLVRDNAQVIRDELGGSISDSQKEYKEFVDYVTSHKIKLTDDVASALATEFGDFQHKFVGLTSKTGVIDDSMFSEMARMFPGLLSGLDQLKGKEEGVLQILHAIEDVRRRTAQLSYTELSKADQTTFSENLKSMVKAGTFDIRGDLAEQLKAEAAKASGALNLNIQVNEEKIVKDIQSALKRAVTANTEPVPINLKVNTKFLRDQIKTNLSGIDLGDLPELASVLMRISSVDSSNILKLGQAFSAFGGKSATRAVDNMKQFGTGLSSLGEEVAKFTSLELNLEPLANLAKAIGTLGRKTVAQAVANIPQLAGGLRQLMLVMSNAPEISENTIRFVQALATLPRTARLVNKEVTPTPTLLQQIGVGAKNSLSGLRKFAQHLKSTKNISAKLSVSLKNLLRQILPIMGIRQLFNWGKNAVETASALTEVQNVVDVTFQNMSSKVEDMASTSIEDFGMSELTVKKVAGRFQAMSAALGIVPSQVQKVSDALEDSRFIYGATENDVADMSLAVTKLAGDLASFHNVEASEAAEALSAIWTGQTRPLRRFGVDLTQATLQEYALSKGMDANIKSMSQAEKTMLRYQYVMDRLGYVQGDFIATSGRSKRAA